MLKRDNAYVIKQELASYLGDLKSQRVSVAQETFRFIEGGPSDAQCIVFLHGTLGNKSQWRGLMQLLSHRYRVIALDIPGLALGFKNVGEQYSLTDLANYINRFLIYKDIDSASLVGHSMGANVACRYQALYPAKINSLVVSSLAGWELLFDQIYWHKFSEFKQSLVFNSLGEFRQLVDSLFYQPPYMPKILLEFRMKEVEKHRPQLFKVLDDIQKDFHFLAEDLKKLSCPTLAINGENDVLVSQGAINRAAQLLPTVKMVNFTECGHVPFLEYPKKTHSVISDFILSTSNLTKMV
ncbi:hypothetical protein A9R00_08690 [Oleispira antarctica]|uniref:AB hydrolase-1 domain-containing protein n=1 Tax=Oleispira antarctica TaxID=188908 RepID=A0A1Y5HYL9_OLEAN|nr:hypothetical protein A9R00_08690 [Oleispira antarctica]